MSRSITTAAGVFAPGHLGELTQYLPFELVDAVLAETGSVQRRLRDLPSRVGVYFVLALGLFPEVGYLRVWNKMTAALAGLGVARPCEKALRDLRRRVGVAPMRALFEVVAGPLARPHTPGVRYRRFRTVAFDGCSSIRVPDAERNRGWLGKIRNKLAWAGYPTVMLMTLAETGTRGLIGAVFGPNDSGEIAYAQRLLHLLGPDMLVLADRGFDGNDFLAAIATGPRAQFLVRLRAARRLPVLRRLSDGSFLSRLGEVTVRIIDADITVTCADGTVIRGRYRLATTLLDERVDPAGTLITLYHERWEIESAYYALRHTMLGGRVLRSGDPVGVEQELWALLTLYQALRMAMVAAIESAPGTDPDRACFSTAWQTARDQVILTAGVSPPDSIDPVAAIGHAVLTTLLPPRRRRLSVRKVKSPTSRYNVRPADDQRPPASQNITHLAIDVHQGQVEPPPPPGRSTPSGASSRLDKLLALLRADPERLWQTRELADALDVDANRRSLWVQLSLWSKRGLIRKAGWRTYQAAPPNPTGPLEPAPKPASRWTRLHALLQAEPDRIWPRRAMAQALQILPAQYQSFYGQLSDWTQQGKIHRITPGHYALTPQDQPETTRNRLTSHPKP